MKKAEVIDGVIVNISNVDPDNIPDWCADWPTVTFESIGWTHDGKTFTAPVRVFDPVKAKALVNAEAERRIYKFFGATDEKSSARKQSNFTQEYLLLKEKTAPSVGDIALMARFVAGAEYVRDVREASNVLNDMDPIPENYADDSQWPPVVSSINAKSKPAKKGKA